MTGEDEQAQGIDYTFDVSGDVESDPEWWKARGKAAEDAATKLRALTLNVDPLFGRNYFGDCIEGRGVHTLFRGVIETWIADLKEQSASAQNLADDRFAAAKTLSDADDDAASHIEQF